MVNTTADYKLEINKPSRSFECKVTIGDNIYTNEDIVDIIFDYPQPSDGFTIGNTISQTLDLTLINRGDIIYSTSQVKVEIGLKIGSKIEYVLMGYYNIDDIEKTDYTTKLTCYDNMIKFETSYFSELTDKPTLQQVVNELAKITGIQFEGSLPAYTVSKLGGFSCREILSYVASICGGNALITRNGKFTIKGLNEVTKTINGDNYFDFKREEVKYKVGKITCQVNENSTLSKGSLGTDSMELSFENPWITEKILTELYNKLNGLSYLGYSMKWQGDLSLDPYDIITVTDAKNVTRKIPLLSQKFTYTGGLTSEIEAKGESKNKNSFSSSGSTTNKVNRLVTEQAIIKEALIDKANIKDLEAVSIKTQTLEAKTAKIEEAIIDVAHVEDLNAINANIENLKAADATINNALIGKADIIQLNAVQGNINTLNSQVANIETLVNGNLTSDNIHSLILTSSKITVENGFIKNAMIENLDVSKINAGTISTDKFLIKSADGGIEINGATQQFKDKNNKVRLQLGKDSQGNFNFILRGEDGASVLLDHTGLKRNAIADGLIINNMIGPGAVTGDKVNIGSLIQEVNKEANTSTIKATKIQLDKEGQSLDIAFNSLKNIIIDQGESIETNSTNISLQQGKIEALISDTSIVEDGLTKKLKDAYASLKLTVNGLNSTVGSHTTNITNLQGQMSTANSNISNLNGKVQTVESKQVSVEQNLSGISQKVSSAESNITTLKGQMTTANNNISAIDGKVATTNNKVAELTTNLNGITQRVGTTESKTSILEKTTEKMLINNFSRSGIKDRWSSNIGTITASNAVGYYANVSTNANTQVTSEKFEIDASKSYKISLMVQNPSENATGSWYFGVYAYDKENKNIGVYVGTSTSLNTNAYFYNEQKANKNTTWRTFEGYIYSHNTVVNVNTPKGNCTNFMKFHSNTKYLVIRFLNYRTTPDYGNGQTGSIYFAHPTISVIDNRIVDTETRLKSAESKITSDAIINTVSSTINTAKQEAINSANSNTANQLKNYATTSSVTQTVNSWVAKFSSSGGANLLLNGGFKRTDRYGWADIEHSAGGTNKARAVWTNQNYVPSGKNVLVLRATNTTGEYGVQQNVKVKANTKYTLSFYVSQHRCPRVGFVVRNSDSTWLTSGNYSDVPSAVANQTGAGYVKKTVTFDTKANTTVGIELTIFDSDNDGYTWFYDVMLNEGEVALPWSQHHSESYEGNTQIDASGVAIKNGAIKVQNNSGQTVLSGDSSGNLWVQNTLSVGGNTNGAVLVKNSSGTPIFSANKNGTFVKDGTMTISSGNITTSGTGYPDGEIKETKHYAYGMTTSYTGASGSQVSKYYGKFHYNTCIIEQDNSGNASGTSYRSYLRDQSLLFQSRQGTGGWSTTSTFSKSGVTLPIGGQVAWSVSGDAAKIYAEQNSSSNATSLCVELGDDGDQDCFRIRNRHWQNGLKDVAVFQRDWIYMNSPIYDLTLGKTLKIDATHPYVDFRSQTSTRRGYIGYGAGTEDPLYIVSDINPTVLVKSHLCPINTNTYWVGTNSPNRKWKGLCAEGGTVGASDIRQKEHIERLDGTLVSYDEINDEIHEFELYNFRKTARAVNNDYYEFMKDRFKPSYYNYKLSEVKNADGEYSIDPTAEYNMLKNVGFIAQDYDLETDPVAREFIFADEEGNLSYNHMSYVTVGMVALQEAIKKIEVLKNENKTLKSEIDVVRNKLNLIEAKLGI